MTSEPSQSTQGAGSLVSYWSGDTLVICDPTNPRAWIESDVSQVVGEPEPASPTRS